MAFEMFDWMGAEAFAECARAEPLATGERARPRTAETRCDHTPQEERIARLASGGASNQEIVTRLFIGSGTVEYHSREVFRKLNVGRRARLAGAVTRSVGWHQSPEVWRR
jgi:DNA-binding CsgD family transcriptional regulator